MLKIILYTYTLLKYYIINMKSDFDDINKSSDKIQIDNELV